MIVTFFSSEIILAVVVVVAVVLEELVAVVVVVDGVVAAIVAVVNGGGHGGQKERQKQQRSKPRYLGSAVFFLALIFSHHLHGRVWDRTCELQNKISAFFDCLMQMCPCDVQSFLFNQEILFGQVLHPPNRAFAVGKKVRVSPTFAIVVFGEDGPLAKIPASCLISCWQR